MKPSSFSRIFAVAAAGVACAAALLAPRQADAQALAPYSYNYTNLPQSLAASTTTNLAAYWNTNLTDPPVFLVRPGYGADIIADFTNAPSVPLQTNNGGTFAFYFAKVTLDASGIQVIESPTNFVFSNAFTGLILSTNTYWDSTGTQSNQLHFTSQTNIPWSLLDGVYGLQLRAYANTGSNAITVNKLVISRPVPNAWPGPQAK